MAENKTTSLSVLDKKFSCLRGMSYEDIEDKFDGDDILHKLAVNPHTPEWILLEILTNWMRDATIIRFEMLDENPSLSYKVLDVMRKIRVDDWLELLRKLDSYKPKLMCK